MKKKLSLGLLLTVILLTGCLFEKLSPMEEVQKKLLEMENYKCEATLVRVSNKGEESYETVQYYKNTGEYRMEILSPESISGNFTVYDGKSICQYNKRLNDKVISDVSEKNHKNELFLGCFIKNYMGSEDVSVDAGAFEDSECIILEAVIPGGDKYIASEKLWVDGESLKPVKFVIYDENGKERYIVTYKEFEYNAEIDDSLFSIN